MAEEKDRNIRLTGEQEELLKELEKQFKRQQQEEKKLPKLIFAVIIALILLALVGTVIHKPEAVPADGIISVQFIDVGQGDCIYITGAGENMLIDCGEASAADKVIGYLENKGVKRLDCVIATHPHSDHMGGMSEIIKNFDIGEVIMPHLADKDVPTTMYFEKFLDAVEKKKVKLKEAKAGKTMTVCGGEWEFIAPCGEGYSSANNYSIGLYLRYGKNSFLFTGDAEKSAEKEMLSSGRVTHADVYKAAHHGSDTSSSKEFLEVVTPDIAVISCGADNSYGHPGKSTVTALKMYTDKIYRTDLSGTITIESDGRELTVRTERSSR